jgi:hypothetical protein
MEKALKFLKVLILVSLVVILAIPSTIFAASFIGIVFPIIADTTLQEVNPSIAYNSQRQEYLVVWSVDRPGNDDIRGQRLSKNGTLLGGPFWISAGSGNERWYPDVTYNSQHDQYLVVWQYYDPTAGNGIKGKRVSGTGVVLDTSDITIRGAGAPTWNDYTPAVAYAYTSDRYLVVYEEVWAGSFFICGNVLDNTGTVGGQITIASNPGNGVSEPDVAYNAHANRFLVVWQYEYSSTDWDIYGHQLEGNGALWGSEISNIASSGISEEKPAVAALSESPTDDKFLVVYEYVTSSTDHNIQGSLLQENGTVDAAGINIATYGGHQEINPAVAGNNSNTEYFVTWRYDHNGSFAPIRGQSLTYYGSLTDNLAQALPTNSNGNFPAVSSGPVGDFMITWQDARGTATFDIYGRLVGNRNYVPFVRH